MNNEGGALTAFSPSLKGSRDSMPFAYMISIYVYGSQFFIYRLIDFNMFIDLNFPKSVIISSSSQAQEILNNIKMNTCQKNYCK